MVAKMALPGHEPQPLPKIRISSLNRSAKGATLSSLGISVTSGESGPVLVLAGEADFISVTRLDEALATQMSGQAVQLIIDAAKLRHAIRLR